MLTLYQLRELKSLLLEYCEVKYWGKHGAFPQTAHSSQNQCLHIISCVFSFDICVHWGIRMIQPRNKIIL